MYPKIIGHNFRPVPAIAKDRFAPHPLLQLVLNPGTYGRVTHTADGHRLTVNVDKAAHAGLIFVYGASTTYGSRLKDGETWASLLSGILGPNYVVENHGVPGYSTVEHILQVLVDFRNVHPKCAIFYLGGTDLRNANLTGLKPDYSDFHLIQQRNMGAAANVGSISRRSAFLSLLSELDRRDVVPVGETRHEYDERLSRIYRQNIHLIAIITQSFAVKPIFVPEIWNYHLLTGNTSTTIVPYIIDADLKEISLRMNADLEAAAGETGSLFLAEPLRVDWQKTDFFDFAHLTPTGSEKLARSIAAHIAAECK
jgi:lysophospholipase L1-like esterase